MTIFLSVGPVISTLHPVRGRKASQSTPSRLAEGKAQSTTDAPSVLEPRSNRSSPPREVLPDVLRLGRERQLSALVELGLERQSVEEQLQDGSVSLEISCQNVRGRDEMESRGRKERTSLRVPSNVL